MTNHITSLYLAMHIANETEYEPRAKVEMPDRRYMSALRNMTEALRTLSKDERDLYYQNLRDKALVSSLRDTFDHCE